MAKVIKNGALVMPGAIVKADLRIEYGKIAAIEQGLREEGDVIDASGCLVFPGFIDAHTHLDMDAGPTLTADNFTTGTRAALRGGTTTVVDFATQERGGSLAEALRAWHAKADGKAYCDYAFHMAVTGWDENVAREVVAMPEAGVTSFKVYMAYDNLRMGDGEIYDLFKRAKDAGAIVACHCENGDLVNHLVAERRAAGQLAPRYHPLSRPDYVEAEAVCRFLAIARAAGAPAYVVHLSTRAGLEEALRARARGQKVVLETCPQYLLLDDGRYAAAGFEGAKYVCSPPLRKGYDQTALWEAALNGSIDLVATDHCSFNFAGQKELGREDFSRIPNGLPGVEHRATLLYTYGVVARKMAPGRMAEILSENPAKVLGMYPQKGALAVGSDADIVIWEDASDAICAADMEQNVDYTPYEGMKIAGRARDVLLRGELAVVGGRLCGEAKGRYVYRGNPQL